jgi:arylsulfatase A-like enzyme
VLAECLLEKGYWTGGFTPNPSCGSAAGFHRGFGVYRDASRKPPLPPDAPTNWKSEWPRLLEMGIPPRDIQTLVDDRELTDLGLRWLGNRDPDEPYFLWLHYVDPHWPCQMVRPPATQEELREAWSDIHVFFSQLVPSRGTFDPGEDARLRWARLYRESLTATDLEIARLIRELRARPDWNRTIIAVTGDHGEELFERGTWHHGWNQLHPEGIHVPLIIRVPGGQPQRLSEPVSLLDLAPTLLDFAGIEPPATMIGKSLRPLMDGRNDVFRPVFTEMMNHASSVVYRLAIRDREWKYIYDIEDPRNSKLFRIPEDPDERVNVRERYTSVYRHFEQMRLAHFSSWLTPRMLRQGAGTDGSAPSANGVSLSQLAADDPNSGNGIMREQLEALGYL